MIRKFLLVLFVSGAAGLFAQAANPADQLFQDAQAAFSSQAWERSARLFGSLATQYPDDPSAPSAAFLRGVSLYQAGQAAAALDLFQKYERSWPSSPYLKRLPYWKGVSAFAAGNLDLAERELTSQSRFPDEAPFYPRSLFTLALVQEKLQKDQEALASLTLFLGKTQEKNLKALAWLRKAEVQTRLSLTDGALESYTLLSAEVPGQPLDFEARRQRALLLLKLQKPEPALALLDETASLFAARSRELDALTAEAAQAAGKPERASKALASLLETEKDPARRQKLLTNQALLADRAVPDEKLWASAAAGPDPALSWQAVRREAEILEKKSRSREAAGVLDQWSTTLGQTSPQREEAVRTAAGLAVEGGDRRLALNLYSRLLKDFASSSQAPAYLFQRGSVALDQGDTEASLSDFLRILKDFPGSDRVNETRYQIGLVYMKRSEPIRAEGWFYGLVNDVQKGDLYERALLARGMSFSNSGQIDLARASFERLLRETPASPWAGQAHYALGRTELQARNFPSAVAAFLQARNLLPEKTDQAQALWAAAEACVSQSDWDQAASLFADYASSYPDQAQAQNAVYRRGLAFYSKKDWAAAFDVWDPAAKVVSGTVLRNVLEGLALDLLQQGQDDEGWKKLALLEKTFSDQEESAGAWYRFAGLAGELGKLELSNRAYQMLIQNHPASAYVESALPRAAGALLTSGNADEAIKRYAAFFNQYGTKSSSAAVARTASAASSSDAVLLEKLVAASRGWKLAPEVRAEFDLALWKSRIDLTPEEALAALQTLSRTAPWSTQRSAAFLIAGQWALRQGKLADARAYLEAAASLGDDLAIFRARLSLASLIEKEGDPAEAARKRELADTQAGSAVPDEFRIPALRDALAYWKKVGKTEDAARVQARVDALSAGQ